MLAPMTNPKKSSYVPVPKATPDVQQRLHVVLLVQTGQLSVSDAARTLGLSRNHFQSLRNRGLTAMVEALSQHSPGRPRGDSELRETQRALQKLERDNDALRAELKAQSDIIGSLTTMVRQQTNKTLGTPRSRARPRAARRTGRKDSSEDSESDPDIRLGKASEMRRAGLSWARCAAAVDRHPATVRRWRYRRAVGEPLARRRGPGPVRKPCTVLHASVAEHVRALRGLVGAESLRRSFGDVSRRQAAAIKSATLTAMERERKASATRVTVTMPGVVRGLDEMYVRVCGEPQKLFVVADAALPLRTTVQLEPAMDERATVRVLRNDMDRHGPPLVYRLDRAKAHDAPAVLRLLREHRVHILHGPPRHPGYYGQLERQNREHRAWLERGPGIDADELERMQRVLNALWRRPSLGWQTAAEAYDAAPRGGIDRDDFHERVDRRAARLRAKVLPPRAPRDFPERLAIEVTLGQLGLLKLEHQRGMTAK